MFAEIAITPVLDTAAHSKCCKLSTPCSYRPHAERWSAAHFALSQTVDTLDSAQLNESHRRQCRRANATSPPRPPAAQRASKRSSVPFS